MPVPATTRNTPCPSHWSFMRAQFRAEWGGVRRSGRSGTRWSGALLLDGLRRGCRRGVSGVSEIDRARAAAALVGLLDLEEGECEQRVRTSVRRSCVRSWKLPKWCNKRLGLPFQRPLFKLKRCCAILGCMEPSGGTGREISPITSFVIVGWSSSRKF